MLLNVYFYAGPCANHILQMHCLRESSQPSTVITLTLYWKEIRLRDVKWLVPSQVASRWSRSDASADRRCTGALRTPDSRRRHTERECRLCRPEFFLREPISGITEAESWYTWEVQEHPSFWGRRFMWREGGTCSVII